MAIREMVIFAVIMAPASHLINRFLRKFTLAFLLFSLLVFIGAATHYIYAQGISGIFPLLILSFNIYIINLLKPKQHLPYIVLSSVSIGLLILTADYLRPLFPLTELSAADDQARLAQFIANDILCLVGLVIFRREIHHSRTLLNRNLKDQHHLINAIERDFFILKANKDMTITHISDSFKNQFPSWSHIDIQNFLKEHSFQKKENFEKELALTINQQPLYLRIHQQYYPHEFENNYQFIIQDISKIKNNEKKLHLALTKELELNKMKNEFITMVSHQFRTPLTTIQSANQLIQLRVDAMTAAEESSKLKNNFNQVFESVESLTGMMERLLDYGKMEANEIKPTFQQVNLEQLIEKQIKRTSAERIQFGIEGTPRLVNADPYFLEHIIINLLTNALKYSEQQVDMLLTFEAEQYELLVKDYGIGIEANELDQLFHPFFRAQNTENIRGTGIGLSFVKKFVELHGGTVDVKSVLTQGSCFWITIPINPQQVMVPVESPNKGDEQPFKIINNRMKNNT
ncbi:HAMP domain-containing sensor histidine kinase [Persicobacter psychrovividus]|uniref:histidine kinase n=1 Tax=Persicobacter psychrovividus TaxID=387638 RepID=A0ABM7VD05_9BACT|nr:hypothetical protein PEPS_10970 [Persicobacter psychrovividus]